MLLNLSGGFKVSSSDKGSKQVKEKILKVLSRLMIELSVNIVEENSTSRHWISTNLCVGTEHVLLKQLGNHSRKNEKK